MKTRTTILVSKELRQKLSIKKAEGGYNSYEEMLRELIKK